SFADKVLERNAATFVDPGRSKEKGTGRPSRYRSSTIAPTTPNRRAHNATTCEIERKHSSASLMWWIRTNGSLKLPTTRLWTRFRINKQPPCGESTNTYL